jgi:hypothetical protein
MLLPAISACELPSQYPDEATRIPSVRRVP